MTLHKGLLSAKSKQKPILSLHHVLDQEVLANPSSSYQQLRTEDLIHWNPFLHAWIIAQYTDVLMMFRYFSIQCTHTREQSIALCLPSLTMLYL